MFTDELIINLALGMSPYIPVCPLHQLVCTGQALLWFSVRGMAVEGLCPTGTGGAWTVTDGMDPVQGCATAKQSMEGVRVKWGCSVCALCVLCVSSLCPLSV